MVRERRTGERIKFTVNDNFEHLVLVGEVRKLVVQYEFVMSRENRNMVHVEKVK